MDSIKEQRHYALFLRISDEEFIDKLLKQGQIHCKSTRWHRRSQEGDKHDGISFYGKGNLEIFNQNHLIGISNDSELIDDDSRNHGNIFCMYGLEYKVFDLANFDIQRILLEEKFRNRGKSAMVVFNGEEFIKRIKSELERQNLIFRIEPVIYFNPNTFFGETGPFYKKDLYSHEHEVRVWIKNLDDEDFEFNIGDITDIAFKITTDDLDKIGVRFEQV